MPTKKNEPRPQNNDPIEADYDDLSPAETAQRMVNEVMRKAQQKAPALPDVPAPDNIEADSWVRRILVRRQENKLFRAQQYNKTGKIIGDIKVARRKNQIRVEAEIKNYQTSADEMLKALAKRHAGRRILQEMHDLQDFMEEAAEIAEQGLPHELLERKLQQLADLYLFTKEDDDECV